MKVIDFLKIISSPFDLYYKGQYVAEIKMNEHDWLKTNCSWVLDCTITSIEVEEDILSINTK